MTKTEAVALAQEVAPLERTALLVFKDRRSIVDSTYLILVQNALSMMLDCPYTLVYPSGVCMGYPGINEPVTL